METPVILSAVRTPVGKFQGGLASLSATELGAKAVAEVVRRVGIDHARGRPQIGFPGRQRRCGPSVGTLVSFG